MKDLLWFMWRHGPLHYVWSKVLRSQVLIKLVIHAILNISMILSTLVIPTTNKKEKAYFLPTFWTILIRILLRNFLRNFIVIFGIQHPWIQPETTVQFSCPLLPPTARQLQWSHLIITAKKASSRDCSWTLSRIKTKFCRQLPQHQLLTPSTFRRDRPPGTARQRRVRFSRIFVDKKRTERATTLRIAPFDSSSQTT